MDAKPLPSRADLVPAFELAADAIVDGDEGTLRSLLRDYPELVRMRSTRKHRAALLHYIGANGVEDERQTTPKNIVAIARMLLDAGAEVDATCDAYGGGDTTLELAATSIHPEKAGVLEELIDLLIARGADVNPPKGSIVLACLQNDRPRGAQLLAKRGARLFFETAAGVGRLDLVKEWIDSTTQRQLDDGFRWACEYGHREVVDFLIDRGVDLRAGETTGQTPLHLAAHHGEIGIMKLLIERGAPLEAKNLYGGTVLGQATWSCMNSGLPADYAAVVELLLDAGADVREADYPTGHARVDELLRRHGRTPTDR
jgi:hypothetical protein